MKNQQRSMQRVMDMKKWNSRWYLQNNNGESFISFRCSGFFFFVFIFLSLALSLLLIQIVIFNFHSFSRFVWIKTYGYINRLQISDFYHSIDRKIILHCCVLSCCFSFLLLSLQIRVSSNTTNEINIHSSWCIWMSLPMRSNPSTMPKNDTNDKWLSDPVRK